MNKIIFKVLTNENKASLSSLWLSGLILAISSINVAAAAVPSAPTGLCLSPTGICATAPTSSNFSITTTPDKGIEISETKPAIKWTPGHYLATYRDHLNFKYSPPRGRPTLIKGNANFKGVLMQWYWKEVEPQEGVYDFSDIFVHLNEFRKWDPQPILELKIGYRDFNTQTPKTIPKYIQNQTPSGIVIDTRSNRVSLAVWRPNGLEPYKRMITALSLAKNPSHSIDPKTGKDYFGVTLDNDPLFGSMHFSESAGGAGGLDATDVDPFSNDPATNNYVQGFIELTEHAKRRFPHSIPWIALNWLGNDTVVQYVADWARDHGYGISAPDMSFPKRQTDGEKAVYPGLTGARDLRGVIPIGRENQISTFMKGTLCNGYTVSNIFDWLITDPKGPKLTHAYWTRRNDVISCNQKWGFNSKTLVPDRRIVNVINRKKAIINDALPAVYQ